MADCVEVVITGPDAEWAADLARVLVEERWAACAHILPEIRSVYRWQGQIEDAPEARLALHTRADLVADIATRVTELHSYDVPCVMALPLVGGLPDYLEWIATETRTD
ncbi:divalent-cation tolerance protein CutA [Mobilicoccus caccae]|uniref:Dihydroorotate dehydrogenase n=1 Tax=Mobilicoccus caccae TaxID=1859295 RepID=A0ABQ6IME3_9MICO|nr:divalent-cation tolerance protein CutA [Mobilicoccus caccae]GMA38357.1 dihydroorotate dehydrogenase [Mobilicoccus caccae]